MVAVIFAMRNVVSFVDFNNVINMFLILFKISLHLELFNCTYQTVEMQCNT